VTTQRANPFAIAFVVLAAAAAAVVWWGPWRQHQTFEPDLHELTDETIESRQVQLAGQVERYSPTNAVRLDDLTAPLASTLRGLPGIARVDVPLMPSKARKRIVSKPSAARQQFLKPADPGRGHQLAVKCLAGTRRCQ
jgi:hypothetical protein